ESVAWHSLSLDDYEGKGLGRPGKELSKVSFDPQLLNDRLWSLTQEAAFRLGFSALKIGKPEELIKQGEQVVNLAILETPNHNDFVKLREGAKHENVNLLLLLPENV